MQEIVVDAKRLQLFFYRYDFDNESETKVREELLKTVPRACNYMFDPDTLVAEVETWHTTTHSLLAHLSLKFCPGCQLKLNSLFYERLKFLGKIQGLLLGWETARARPPVIEPTLCRPRFRTFLVMTS
jgi:hypothetical protein